MLKAQHESAAASEPSKLTAQPSESRKVSFQRPTAAPSQASSATRPTSSTSGVGASASSQAYSAYSGVTRRHSLFGTEDRVVLDIGSRYSKFGFSGEPRPRAIVPSVSFSQPSTSYLRFDTCSGKSDPYRNDDTLWDLDFERCADDQLRRGKRALVLAQLTQLLRKAYTQHLMVDPKQRKVLVVENPLLPNSIKELICKVLFNNLQVPSVSFVPAPLLSMLAVGRITGLVLEVGYLETTLVPVYYGRPMESHLASSPRAGKRLNARLKCLLLHYGKFVAAQTSLQEAAKPLRERTFAIDPSVLTDERMEQIKAKALFVSSLNPGLRGVEESLADLELDPCNSDSSSRDMTTKAAMAIRQRYSSASSATPFTFAISPRSVDPQGTASLIQSVQAPPLASASTLNSTPATTQSTGVIVMPGWVRERAAELLFEAGDQDDPSLIDMAVSVIAKLSLDLRRIMCENILVSGGTAMLPGFANRFRTQLAAAVEKAEQSGGVLSIDRHAPPLGSARDSQVAKKNDQGSSLHRSIAVLNDPWPDVANPQMESGKKGRGSAEGGAAPAFAANLLPWMGASLAGALKTTSLNAISREAYDEATKSGHGETEAGDDAVGTEREREKERTAGGNSAGAGTSRPTVLGTSKRGSFVGVVGGLETGAFGGLAAVSRHLIGVPGATGGSSSTSQAKPAVSTGGSASSAAPSPPATKS